MKEGLPVECPTVMEVFEQSQRFKDFIERAKRFLRENPTNLSQSVVDSFAGRLFEEWAFDFLSKTTPGGLHLLDPEETIKFFMRLFPEAKPIQHRLQNGLANVDVPDGILIDKDGAVIRVIEYSSQGPRNHLGRYVHNKVDHLKGLRRKVPQVFGNSELHVMFTKDVHESYISQRGRPKNAKLVPLPMQHDEFHHRAQELARFHLGVGLTSPDK